MTTARMPFLVVTLGVFLLSIMDALIKIVATDYPTAQIVGMRFLCGLPWAVLVVLWLRPAWPSADMLRAHVFRGFVVVITASLFFYALAKLELAEAIALSFLAPLFLAVLAALILRERISPRVFGAIVAGFIGMGVILWGKAIGGNVTDARLWGAAAAIACAFTYAANLVLLRKRAQTDPLALIVLFQNLFPLLIVSPFALAVWVEPKPEAWFLFAGIGALGIAGHSCMAWGFARANAGPLGVIEYTALIWGAGLGFAFFGEVPAWTTWAGAGLIVAACLLVARGKTAS